MNFQKERLEKMPRKAATDSDANETDQEIKFVRMQKGDEIMDQVHPDVVEMHKKLGWVVIEETAADPK
jgi:hypothetical protein